MSETIGDTTNETNANVEQITKTPTTPMKKVKDPKKVAAGKKLAEYNKRAKQKQKEVQESQPPEPEATTDESTSWLPETSLTTMIALVGLGLTAGDLFLRYKSQKARESEKPVHEFKAVETISPPQTKFNMSTENKLVKIVTESAMLVGISAGVGYLGRKIIKEPLNK